MKYKRPAREIAYLHVLRHATRMKCQGGLCYGILIKCLRVLDKIRRWQWALDKSSKG